MRTIFNHVYLFISEPWIFGPVNYMLLYNKNCPEKFNDYSAKLFVIIYSLMIQFESTMNLCSKKPTFTCRPRKEEFVFKVLNNYEILASKITIFTKY